MREYTTHRSWMKKPSVKKGDVIIKCEPFAYVIDSDNSGKYCDHCLAYYEDCVLRCCRNCWAVFYCSDNCVAEGWKVHQCECEGLKKLRPAYPPNYCRLIVRLIHKLRNGGNEFSEKVNDKERRRFKDLMNHYSDIKDDPDRLKDINKVKETLEICLGAANVPNESEIFGIYGRMLVNRFCLLDSLMMPVGTAVYIAGSIFDHSCIPTAYPSFEGKTLIIRTLVDNPRFDITKVRISYGDPAKPCKWRREHLRDTWYFWCDCQRCNDDNFKWMENTMICDNENCCGPVNVPEKVTEPLKCNECGSEIEKKSVDKYLDILGFTIFRFGKLKEDNLVFEDCCELVTRQEKVFFYMNAWRVRSLNYAFNAALYKGGWSLAYSYGTRNLEGMRYYHGNEHPHLGMFLLKLGKTALNLRCFNEGVEYLNEAEKILKIALGPTHRILVDEIPKLQLLANEDISILIARRLAAAKEKEEKEKKEKEEMEQLNKILQRNLSSNATPIWEKDKKVFQSEREWKQNLNL